MNKWKLTRINQGYQMTRVEGDSIACRELIFWEKIKLALSSLDKPLTDKDI